MYRIILSLIGSLAIALAIGPGLIARLRKLHFGQTIYELGPDHQSKQGTPVMGGLMMAAAMLVCPLVFHPHEWQGVWDFAFPLLTVSLLSMAVGFADDWIKAVKKRHEGLTPWQKIVGQVVVGASFSVYCFFNPSVGSSVIVPFFHTELDLGLFYIPLMTLLIIFIVNSSNLQDGLDGLLGTVSMISSSSWGLLALITFMLAPETLNGANGQMIAIFAMAMVGSCIGFLRFNRYPAKTFMGDTGSMLLGGGTVAMAILMRQPFLLLFSFCMPIVSSLSVIIQRYYFKLTHGKRIFRMSPLHHHFELSGYTETQIVSMYAGITLLLSLIGLMGSL